MPKRFLYALVLSLLALSLMSSAALAAHTVNLTASLSGKAEVPGPGDADGTGMAQVEVYPGNGVICYDLTAANIMTAAAAHIHHGKEGVAGPVVVPLTPPFNGAIQGCVQADRELARDIAANPANYYVNVHNPTFPGGAIRGQLKH